MFSSIGLCPSHLEGGRPIPGKSVKVNWPAKLVSIEQPFRVKLAAWLVSIIQLVGVIIYSYIWIYTYMDFMNTSRQKKDRQVVYHYFRSGFYSNQSLSKSCYIRVWYYFMVKQVTKITVQSYIKYYIITCFFLFEKIPLVASFPWCPVLPSYLRLPRFQPLRSAPWFGVSWRVSSRVPWRCRWTTSPPRSWRRSPTPRRAGFLGAWGFQQGKNQQGKRGGNHGGLTKELVWFMWWFVVTLSSQNAGLPWLEPAQKGGTEQDYWA